MFVSEHFSSHQLQALEILLRTNLDLISEQVSHKLNQTTLMGFDLRIAQTKSLEIQCPIYCTTEPETVCKRHDSSVQSFILITAMPTTREFALQCDLEAILLEWCFISDCKKVATAITVHQQKHQALLGFEPRITCLQDRHFDQLSHSATGIHLCFLCLS